MSLWIREEVQKVLWKIFREKIGTWQHILINGAAGSFGTFAIQLAKYYGAEVTAVDALEKFDVLESSGADHLIDYQSDSFYKHINTYDIIFDIVSNSHFKKGNLVIHVSDIDS